MIVYHVMKNTWFSVVVESRFCHTMTRLWIRWFHMLMHIHFDIKYVSHDYCNLYLGSWVWVSVWVGYCYSRAMVAERGLYQREAW